MNLESFKKTMEKADTFDVIVEQLDNEKKHMKGYIFDSLVYRYKIALEDTVVTRAERYQQDKFCSKKEAEMYVRNLNNRDLMRFIQILDEAIGEHD